MKKRLCMILAFGWLVSVASWCGAADYQIIVNAANGSASLSKGDVVKMMMKKSTAWPDGTGVLVVDQKASTTVRAAFSEDVLGKSVTSVKNYWQQMVFSGQATAPPEKDSDAEVVSYVSENKGAIGYVSPGAALDSSVKTVTLQE